MLRAIISQGAEQEKTLASRVSLQAGNLQANAAVAEWNRGLISICSQLTDKMKTMGCRRKKEQSTNKVAAT